MLKSGIEEKKVTMNMQSRLCSTNCIILFVTEIRSSTVREELKSQNEELSTGISEIFISPIEFTDDEVSVQPTKGGLVRS